MIVVVATAVCFLPLFISLYFWYHQPPPRP
jgi:hypothetical protein